MDTLSGISKRICLNSMTARSHENPDPTSESVHVYISFFITHMHVPKRYCVVRQPQYYLGRVHQYRHVSLGHVPAFY